MRREPQLRRAIAVVEGMLGGTVIGEEVHGSAVDQPKVGVDTGGVEVSAVRVSGEPSGSSSGAEADGWHPLPVGS